MSVMPDITPPIDAKEMLGGHKGSQTLDRSTRILFAGDCAWVELTKGQWTIIDLVSVVMVARHVWHASANSSGDRFYAMAVIDGKRIGMHRFLMGVDATDDRVVDHIDGNSLNNRLDNLRSCSNTDNIRNARRSASNRSGFKGVTFKPRSNRYIARIRVDGMEKYLGCFTRAEDAHAAYVRAAREHFGEFANAGEARLPAGSRRAEG